MAALAVAALGIALRVAAARGELWLDEIWSLALAREAGSAWGVLSRLHHDNNHHLNTLWLGLVGPDAAPLLLRLPAILASAALLLLAASGRLVRGAAETLAATVLLSGSWLLVHYGSEARGYALALLAAMAGYHALERWLETRCHGAALALAAAVAFGLLAHLTFLYALCGYLAWAALELARARREPRPVAAGIAALGAGLILLAGLWLVDLRHVVVGGGPLTGHFVPLRELMRATFGLPRGWPGLLGVAAVVVAAAEVGRLARQRDARAAFFAVAVVLAPAASLLLRPETRLAPRYFLVAVPFLLLLLARALGRLERTGRRGRLAFALLLAAFLAGNAVPVGRVVRDGRSHYREAVVWMAARTAEPVVTIGGDHDFRHSIVLEHAVRGLGIAKGVAWVTVGEGVEAPIWYLRQGLEPEPEPMPKAENSVEVGGKRYVEVKRYPWAGLSGWELKVYRRVE